MTVSHPDFLNCLLLLDYIFRTFNTSKLFDKLSSYIMICGRFWYVVTKYFFGKSGRLDTPDIFKNFNLNTCPSWP